MASTIEYNADELCTPEWLNESFIEKVLQHCEQSTKVEVENLNVSPATAKGDHFASVMFRVIVEYCLNDEKKSKSLIIKTIPEVDGNKKELLKESRAFDTEIGMYSEIIPKFESILRSIGDQTKLAAPCLYYSLSPRKLIVFEDVVTQNYTVLRDRQINLEEAKAAYTKLGKFHAISYKLRMENTHIFKKYSNGHFLDPKLRDSPSFHDGITNFIELLETNEDLVMYKPYFTPFVGTIVDECEKLFRKAFDNPEENALYGLCHGDFHFKNLMFKHTKSGKLEDVMLLDYQMCYFGPLVNDIIYSIYLLLSAEQRSKHLNELLYCYFKTFQETLKKIGFNGQIPRFIEFSIEMIKHKNFEIFLMVSFLPLWYAFTEATMDVEDIIFNSEKRKLLYNDPRYIAELRELLPKYLHLGYFE